MFKEGPSSKVNAQSVFERHFVLTVPDLGNLASSLYWAVKAGFTATALPWTKTGYSIEKRGFWQRERPIRMTQKYAIFLF